MMQKDNGLDIKYLSILPAILQKSHGFISFDGSTWSKSQSYHRSHTYLIAWGVFITHRYVWLIIHNCTQGINASENRRGMHEWTIQRLATIDTQDTGKGNKQTNPTTQQRKLIRWSTRTSPKTGDEPRCPGSSFIL